MMPSACATAKSRDFGEAEIAVILDSFFSWCTSFGRKSNVPVIFVTKPSFVAGLGSLEVNSILIPPLSSPSTKEDPPKSRVI